MKRIVSIILIAATAFIFAGCEKEKDRNNDIFGKWISEYDTMVFNADGTGSNSYYSSTYDFTYEFTGENGLFINIGAADGVQYTYTVDGDKLVLHDEYYGGDIEYYREGTTPPVLPRPVL